MTLTVSCPQLQQSDTAILKVGDGTGGSQGTILFYAGFTGMYFWEENGAEAARILGELRQAGYRTVQMKWQHNWFLAASGQLEGFGRLACRPATVARWVYDNLRVDAAPFCATGHSNGASELAYTMTQYGVGDLFAAALFESGPNWARVDSACLFSNATASLFQGASDRGLIDLAFGYPNNGTGPCARRDPNFQPVFGEASIAFGSWQYVFPQTVVWSVFGGQDTSSTAIHGRYFYQFLLDAGSPQLHTETLSSAGHFVSANAAGANLIRDMMLSECHSH